MAGKKIFIEYDVDSSDLKIANGETLSLTQQLRILKKELQRGDIGQKEFEILRKKIGDTEDQIAKTTVKSKDFFGVLSSLPGPVGAFGSSILGVVDTLKIFSSFSFKDIKNSLGDVLDDVKEITENFFGLKKATDDIGQSNKDLSNSSNQTTNSLANQATQAGTTAAALQNQTRQIQLATVATDANGQAMIRATKPYSQMTEAERALFNEQRKVIVSTGQLANAQVQGAGASEAATGAVVTQTVATEGLTIAQRAATFAANALKIALASLGIGLVIIAVTKLVEITSEYITGAKAAEEENKRLTKSFELLKRSIDDTQQAIKDQTELTVLQAKIAGKTEEEIFNIVKEGLDKRVEANKKAAKDIERELLNLSLNTKLSEEDRLKKQEELEKETARITEQGINLRIEGEKLVLTEELRIADKRRAKQKEANDKALAQSKEYQQKRINDTKTAEEQLAELIRSNSELRIRDDRERQFQELKNQKEVEEQKIKSLLISEELRGKLLEQVRLKYGFKLLNMNQKFVEEDLKALKDFQRKREDIEIAAIADVRQREDTERAFKLSRELEDLEEDKNFIKLSEEEKEKIRQNIRLAYQNQTNELVKSREKDALDDRLKKLDDELRFLQIRQEAIRAGTIAFYDNQREILAAAEKREIELAEGKEKEITAIKEKYVKLRKDLDQQEKLATLSAIGETIGAFAGLTAAIASSYDEEAQSSKEAFEKRKKLLVATAIMQGASGIISILAQPSTLPSPFDWIVKGINAAALAVATGVNVSKIQKTQFEGGGGASGPGTVRGMAKGGYIDGPRHAQGGVLIEAEGGEAVMTRGAVSMFGPLLSMMNQAGGGTNFNKDMMTTANDAPLTKNGSEESPMILKTYIVSNELTTEVEKQARLKNLSTL
jgi:hypothetical protein